MNNANFSDDSQPPIEEDTRIEEILVDFGALNTNTKIISKTNSDDYLENCFSIQYTIIILLLKGRKTITSHTGRTLHVKVSTPRHVAHKMLRNGENIKMRILYINTLGDKPSYSFGVYVDTLSDHQGPTT